MNHGSRLKDVKDSDQSNLYDGAFLQKPLTIFEKRFIKDLRLVSKYASVHSREVSEVYIGTSLQI